MVFVLMALLFDAIFSRFLGSDMVQLSSINGPKYVFSRIFMQLESKKHVFSRDFGLHISPGSLLGLLRFTHAKNTYFLVYFCCQIANNTYFLVFLGRHLGITGFDGEPFWSIFGVILEIQIDLFFQCFFDCLFGRFYIDFWLMFGSFVWIVLLRGRL